MSFQHLETSQWALHGVRAAAAAIPWWVQYRTRWNPARRRIWIGVGVALTLICVGFLAYDLRVPELTGIGFEES
jgi:hypothetical protein